MKKFMLVIFLVIFGVSNIFSQDYRLNKPGDDLNLYSVLNIFQKSETLEIFEKNLNDPEYKINNLDLNQDNKIDYIHVIDHVNGSAHAIVLRVNIDQYETQDVAVIEVDKVEGNIHVQIIGDEELYGENYIIEPHEYNTNPGYEGQTTTVYVPPVSTWLIFSYMYNPYYNPYYSPYYWGYYPNYWYPWAPVYYTTYYGYHNIYYNYYRRGLYYRSPNAHVYYSPRRIVSPTVVTRRGGTYVAPHHSTSPSNLNNPSRSTRPTRTYSNPDRSTRTYSNPDRSTRTYSNPDRSTRTYSNPTNRQYRHLPSNNIDRSRPIMNRPSNNNMSRPSNNNMSRPSNNNMSRPSNNNMSRPSNNNMSRPSNNNMSRPSNNNMSRPSNNNMSKPSRSTQPSSSPNRSNKGVR